MGCGAGTCSVTSSCSRRQAKARPGADPRRATSTMEDTTMLNPNSTPSREIVYDRESRDFALYLDGELVGFARSYHEGEVTLDQLALEAIAFAAGWDAAADLARAS